MKLDTYTLHRHLQKKLHLMSKPQRHLVEELGISRSTMWRLTKDKELHVSTLLKLIEWLGTDVSRYVVKKEHYDTIKPYRK